MKLISGLSESYQLQDVKDALDTIKEAISKLNTLGQIQAAVGGLSMSALANETFETKAKLENLHAILENGTKKGYQFYTEYAPTTIVGVVPEGCSVSAKVTNDTRHIKLWRVDMPVPDSQEAG